MTATPRAAQAASPGPAETVATRVVPVKESTSAAAAAPGRTRCSATRIAPGAYATRSRSTAPVSGSAKSFCHRFTAVAVAAEKSSSTVNPS
ncbi:hypothetical protein Pflav_026080 [Phytohabitans flavus]|uniref:Uncharacterized protein n=1 Tax=Phytohabitans flavus TaxID=1076124 RepID=A0A6F8XR17_9ACTN|nr:hypothetical protein [Phytohabitans flavus]BCB76198.1 hypothetical protein Pflav_026080 [Phytohabitans flavus]